MAQKSSIATDLSPDDLADFRRLLAEGRLSIDGLTDWLAGRGYTISRSAVGRFSKDFQTVAAKMRQTREVTDALVAEIGDAAAQGKQGRLLVEMSRSIVFDLLVKLQSSEAEIDTKDVQQLGKGLAELSRSLRLDQDFEQKVWEEARRKAAEEMAGMLEEEAKANKGLTAEAVSRLKANFLGLKSPEKAGS